MTDNVYLNADRTQVVEEWTAGKKWQVPRKVAVEMGLLDVADKPVQTRRVTTEPKPPQRRRNATRQGQDRGKNQDLTHEPR